MNIDPFRRWAVATPSIALVVVLLVLPESWAYGSDRPGDTGGFLRKFCLDCHAGADAESDFRLDEMNVDLQDPGNFRKWVSVHDRIQNGEMPPSGAEQPDPQDRATVVDALGAELTRVNLTDQRQSGRVQLRRLNRVEYEATLRDLLVLPNLEVAEMLPPDASAHGFDNVGSALELSFVQMSRYLDAAAAALDQAMELSPRPHSTRTRLEAKTNGRFAQVLKKGTEAVLVGDAVGLLRQPNTAQAPWWWSKVEPPVDGNYRVRMKSFGFVWDKGDVLPADRAHVVTFHAVQGTTKRPLGTFDVGNSSQQPTVHDFTAFLRQGDQIQIWFETLDDRSLRKGELSQYTAPGVALEWLEVEGPLPVSSSDNEAGATSDHRLFGDLSIVPWTSDSGLKEPAIPIITEGVGKRAKRVPAKRKKISLYRVDSQHPSEDARRLLRDFAERAFRRPTDASELEDIFQLVKTKLDQNHCFQEAMRVGFQAILCSPEFLFLRERSGVLDDHALASRLSYFFWNSMPDATLLTLAERGLLSEPDVLRQQVDRMIDDPKSGRFVESFCGQWLDLRRITITQPDEQLYPEFDPLLQHSMVDETRAYFAELVRSNLGISHLVDSDFVMVNARLAELYDIADVDGVRLRKVTLPKNSPRGGLLTQASVMKVTANGTSTSPVTRGAWVLDRIYGTPAPPPPPNIPAVEPDLRGTTTIRQQLDKHRDDPSCASCHRRIDPPGFALESFDVIGGWRDRYRSLENGEDANVTFKDNRPVRYKLGLAVDSSGTAPGGETFDDIHGLREILLGQTEQLARNMVQRLIVYATGSGIQFADRRVVESIVNQTRDDNYGLRTLIHAVVQSDVFRRK